MHGAPLLHGIEIYHDRPIFYDLGNFFFNAPPTMWTLQEPMTWESVVPSLEFRGKHLQSIRLRPIVLNFLGQGQPDTSDPQQTICFWTPVACQPRQQASKPVIFSSAWPSCRGPSER